MKKKISRILLLVITCLLVNHNVEAYTLSEKVGSFSGSGATYTFDDNIAESIGEPVYTYKADGNSSTYCLDAGLLSPVSGSGETGTNNDPNLYSYNVINDQTNNELDRALGVMTSKYISGNDESYAAVLLAVRIFYNGVLDHYSIDGGLANPANKKYQIHFLRYLYTLRKWINEESSIRTKLSSLSVTSASVDSKIATVKSKMNFDSSDTNDYAITSDGTSGKTIINNAKDILIAGLNEYTTSRNVPVIKAEYVKTIEESGTKYYVISFKTSDFITGSSKNKFRIVDETSNLKAKRYSDVEPFSLSDGFSIPNFNSFNLPFDTSSTTRYLIVEDLDGSGSGTIKYEYEAEGLYSGSLLSTNSSMTGGNYQRFLTGSPVIQAKVEINGSTLPPENPDICKTTSSMSYCEDSERLEFNDKGDTVVVSEYKEALLKSDNSVDVKSCLISLDETDKKAVTKNFCNVYCKEDLEFVTPYKLDSANGRKIVLYANVKGTQSCYTAIDHDGFEEAMRIAQEKIDDLNDEIDNIDDVVIPGIRDEMTKFVNLYTNLQNYEKYFINGESVDYLDWYDFYNLSTALYNVIELSGRDPDDSYFSTYPDFIWYHQREPLYKLKDFIYETYPSSRVVADTLRSTANLYDPEYYEIDNAINLMRRYYQNYDIFYDAMSNLWNRYLRDSSLFDDFLDDIDSYSYGYYPDYEGLYNRWYYVRNVSYDDYKDDFIDAYNFLYSFSSGSTIIPNIINEARDYYLGLIDDQEALKDLLRDEIDDWEAKKDEYKENIRSCQEDDFMNIPYNFDPQIKYNYGEPYNSTVSSTYIEQATAINKQYLEKQTEERSSLDEESFNCKNISNDFDHCTGGYDSSKVYYRKSVSTVKAKYVLPKVYYINTPGNVMITETAPDDDKYMPVGGLPIGFNTSKGDYKYEILFNNIGTDYSTGSLGRIFGDSGYNASSSDIDNNYSCIYQVGGNTLCVDSSGTPHTKNECNYGENDKDCEERLCPSGGGGPEGGPEYYCVAVGPSDDQEFYVCDGKTFEGSTCSSYGKGTAARAAALTYVGCTGDDTCSYNVSCCPDCIITCEPPDCSVTYDNGRPNVDYRTITTTDINPNDRPVGANWDEDGWDVLIHTPSADVENKRAIKAHYTISEIESYESNRYLAGSAAAEEIGAFNFDDYSMVVVMTPDMANDIRNYNTSKNPNGSYTDDSLKCKDYEVSGYNESSCEANGYNWKSGKCWIENIFCYSEFIDYLINNYGTDKVRVNNRPNPNNNLSGFTDYSLGGISTGAVTSPGGGYWTIYPYYVDGTGNAGPSWK